MKRKTKRYLIGCVGVPVALILVLAFGSWALLRTARHNWKEAAIPEIERCANDQDWVAKEISRLSMSSSRKDPTIFADGWLSDRLILMKNGEWLVYKAHCSKVPPRHVSDIFIAKGSNGRWYYSTFHFCVDMIVLVMDERQPPDLRWFVTEYRCEEFDGKSDECLKKTKSWPASCEQSTGTIIDGKAQGTKVEH